MSHPFTQQAVFQELDGPIAHCSGQFYNASFIPLSEFVYEFRASQWNMKNPDQKISREQVHAAYVVYQVGALAGRFGDCPIGTHQTTPEERAFCSDPLNAEKAAAWALVRPARANLWR